MVIEVRYRDIPFDEMKRCSPSGVMTAEMWEGEWRGATIQIETPAIDMDIHGAFVCGGPVFRVFGRKSLKPGSFVGICPHIAEIGD